MTSSTDAALINVVKTGAVPNAVAIAADRNGTVYQRAAGRIAGCDSDPVSQTSRCRIVSMTTTVTTAAGLQLVVIGVCSVV